MTLRVVVTIHCDHVDCKRWIDGQELPDGWSVVPGPAYSGLPSSVHFCPEHTDGPAHLEALRKMRG